MELNRGEGPPSVSLLATGDVVELPNGTLWMYYFGGGDGDRDREWWADAKDVRLDDGWTMRR